MSNGVFPVDYGTDVGLVRGLIPDTTTVDNTADTDYVFSDNQIEAFLAFNAGNVRLTAAMFVETIATDEALLYRYLRTDDLTVDGTKGAEVLLRRARALRDEADALAAADAVDAFQIVYPNESTFIPEATPAMGRAWTWKPWR